MSKSTVSRIIRKLYKEVLNFSEPSVPPGRHLSTLNSSSSGPNPSLPYNLPLNINSPQIIFFLFNMKVSRQSELIWEGFDLMQPHPYFMNIWSGGDIPRRSTYFITFRANWSHPSIAWKKKITCHEPVYYYLANFILFYLHWSRWKYYFVSLQTLSPQTVIC